MGMKWKIKRKKQKPRWGWRIPTGCSSMGDPPGPEPKHFMVPHWKSEKCSLSITQFGLSIVINCVIDLSCGSSFGRVTA